MLYDRIILADLHLDDNPLTEYRWEVFPWVMGLCKKHDINLIDILGDITDKKDKHSAVLTNRLIENFFELSTYGDIRILKGNHDYIDEETPYFKFLKNIAGMNFFSEPSISLDTLFIPHIKNFDINNYSDFFNESLIKVVYMHQMFKGSTLQNGYITEDGIDVDSVVKAFNKPVFSGDIHTPQIINKITYVGAPYHVTFGDTYKGGCIIIKDGKVTFKPFNSIKRLYLHLDNSFTEKDFSDIRENDQVKVKVELKLHETYEWDTTRTKIKNTINSKKALPVSIEMKLIKEVGSVSKKEYKEKTDLDIIESFAKKENLETDFINVAKELII